MMDDELLANPQVAAATSRALLTIGGQMQFLLKHAQECENLRNDAIARANVLTAEVERLKDENTALRAQLAAAGEALIALLEISCVCTELDKTILKTDDGRPKLFRWDKRASEPAFSFLERHGRLENLGNGTFAARAAPGQE